VHFQHYTAPLSPYPLTAHSPVSMWNIAWLPRRLVAVPSCAMNDLPPAAGPSRAAELPALLAGAPTLAAPINMCREFCRGFQSAGNAACRVVPVWGEVDARGVP